MDNDDRMPRQRPLAFPSQDSHGPSYDAAVERSQAAFTAAAAVLGQPPVLDTVGDLGALVAKLPADMSLRIDNQIRIGRTLSNIGDNGVIAVVASMAMVHQTPLFPVRDNHGQDHDVLEPALELGLQVLPSPDAPAAVKTRLCNPDDLADEALELGETGTYLKLVATMCTTFANQLTGRAAENVPDGATAEMRAIAEDLRGLAERLKVHGPQVDRLIDE